MTTTQQMLESERISIHPPREGWDFLCNSNNTGIVLFQSTHPVRGGTSNASISFPPKAISIHPPREGWDLLFRVCSRWQDISIHPPREGWDVTDLCIERVENIFQSTHPVRGGTYSAV